MDLEQLFKRMVVAKTRPMREVFLGILISELSEFFSDVGINEFSVSHFSLLHATALVAVIERFDLASEYILDEKLREKQRGAAFQKICYFHKSIVEQGRQYILSHIYLGSFQTVENFEQKIQELSLQYPSTTNFWDNNNGE